jgi:hypothetical protein
VGRDHWRHGLRSVEVIERRRAATAEMRGRYSAESRDLAAMIWDLKAEAKRLMELT